MEVIIVVLPVALALATLALLACVRAIRSGQFDDLETPAVRVLLDDVPLRTEPSGPAGRHPPETVGEAVTES